jgi:hypothetical protein
MFAHVGGQALAKWFDCWDDSAKAHASIGFIEPNLSIWRIGRLDRGGAPGMDPWMFKWAVNDATWSTAKANGIVPAGA